MKNKIGFIASMILVFTFTSCKKEFLEIVPADQPVVDAFYTNEAEIKAATASLYTRPWFEYNDKFSWCAGDGMAGDLHNDYLDEGQMYFFAFGSTNSVISQGWRGLFNVVTFANAIISDMPRIAGGHGVSQDVINEALGEAYFIRGFAYYLLTEYWGEVPVVENTASIITSGNINVPKNTQASIYNFIQRDLEFARDNLPATNDFGRVTSWSARGMLAKLHVTRGQYLGSQADFDAAKAYALEVINQSGLTLMPNYGDLFTIENNNNPESLFALQWMNGAWGTGNSRQAVMGRSSIITGNDEAWGGGKSTSYDFNLSLIANAEGGTDLRQREIFMTLGEHYPELNAEEGGYTYNIITVDPGGGGDIEYAAPLLNNIRKYLVGKASDVGVSINNQATPLNQYMLRLADVYLIYAEAEIGTGTSTSDATALNFYNAVRTRAGLSPRTDITFDQLFTERRIEFGIEGYNWLDVKRLFYRSSTAAITYLNQQNRGLVYEAVPGYTGDRNSYDAFQLLPPSTAITVTEDDFFLPVPATEITGNPMLAPTEEAVEWKPSN